jgi:hypothetical protein
LQQNGLPLGTQKTKLMQRNLLSLLLLLLLPLSLAAQSVELFPLNNYFVKNTVKLKTGLNGKVFAAKKDFDNYFGIAKTATNAITVPDFQSFRVISIAAPASNKATTLSIDSAKRSGKTLQVYCSKVQGSTQTYSTVPVTLVMIKKDPAIRQYYFYEKGKRVQQVKCTR